MKDIKFEIKDGEKSYALYLEQKNLVCIINEKAVVIVIPEERIFNLIDFIFNEVLEEIKK